jgi:hypothetical protein
MRFLGAELFHADSLTDRRTDAQHEKANSRFCNFSNAPKTLRETNKYTLYANAEFFNTKFYGAKLWNVKNMNLPQYES